MESSSEADTLTATQSEVDGGICNPPSFANVDYKRVVSVMGAATYEATTLDAKIIGDSEGRKVGRADSNGMLRLLGTLSNTE